MLNRELFSGDEVSLFRVASSRFLFWGGRSGSICLIWVVVLASVLTSWGVSAENLRGVLVVSGRGPELEVIEDLARSFEKAHLGTAVEIKWNKNFRPVDMVKEGEADLAVTGEEEEGLVSTVVAWDGLAVIVNFSNPIKEVTKRDLTALFTRSIRDWVELDEKAEGKVRLIVRPEDQNLTKGFETSLGIDRQLTQGAERIRSDQRVLSRVSGQLDAVGYLSLHAALEAVKYGTSVRILLVDGVEPGNPTILAGTYPLKRPVVFHTVERPSPSAQAFIRFALSPEGRAVLERTYVSAAR